MIHSSETRILVAAIVAGVALAVATAGLDGSRAPWPFTAASLTAAAAAQPPRAGCPQGAQPLPASAVAPASRAALRSQRERYGELGTRPLVTRAALAEFDDARGPQARRECGRRVERRTVVVYLDSVSAAFRRRNPSLSKGVVFVSRSPGGTYRVWRVVR